MDKTAIASIVDYWVRFFDANPSIVTIIVSTITAVLGGLVTRAFDVFKKYEVIETEKFNKVILPCMLIIEPVLYNDITSDKLREIKRLCRSNPKLVSIQVFHWIDYKLNYIEKGIGDEKLAKESFDSLCTYFSNCYNRMCKIYYLQKRGIQYKRYFNQYHTKAERFLDFVSFTSIMFCVVVILFLLYFIMMAFLFR
jgi:hypothetical protein